MSFPRSRRSAVWISGWSVPGCASCCRLRWTSGAVVSFGGIGRLSQCSMTFAMSVSIRGRDGGAMAEVSDLPNLRAASGGGSRAYLLFDPKGQRGKGGGGIGPEETLLPSSSAVRRLTPTECERLMSWPDGWTAVDGPDTPDSRRYAACGDGVVSNAAEWIARGIMQED